MITRVQLEVRLAAHPFALDRLVGTLRRKGAEVSELVYVRGEGDRYDTARVVVGTAAERLAHIVACLRREVLVLSVQTDREAQP